MTKIKLHKLLNNETAPALIALMGVKTLDGLTKIKLVRLRKKLAEKHSDIRSAKLSEKQVTEALNEEIDVKIKPIDAKILSDHIDANMLFSLESAGLVTLGE